MRKYKLFGKIPIFDLVIIIVLIAVAFLGYKILNTSKSGESITGTEIKKVSYKIEFQNLSEQVDGVPDIGEKIFDFNTNTELGTVVSAESKPYVMYDYNSVTGEAVKTEYKDRVTICVVVESNASVSAKATEINGTKIGIGKNMTFNMPSLCASGIITNIVEVEG